MLVYTPAQDSMHCAYRFLSSFEGSTYTEFRWDVFRVLDMFRLYPRIIIDLKKVPREFTRYKKVFKAAPESYFMPTDLRTALFSLQPIHNTVANWLIGKGFFDVDAFRAGKIQRTDLALPEKLQEEVKRDSILKTEWMNVLLNIFPQMNFDGPKGMKARFGLMEYRYDNEEDA